MIGTAGLGKTAKFLYQNIEYCCASGMSFITSDTKGYLLRRYAPIVKKYYGYDISVLDLRKITIINMKKIKIYILNLILKNFKHIIWFSIQLIIIFNSQKNF